MADRHVAHIHGHAEHRKLLSAADRADFRQSHGEGKTDTRVNVLFGQEIFVAAPGSRIIPTKDWQTKEFSYERA